MKIEISYTNNKPMYEQIKDSIKAEIYNGKLKNNDPLPSMRQLAKDLNISMITTKRAYVDLEQEGFVYSILGKGTFIKLKNYDEAVLARENELLSLVNSSCQKCREAGISKRKINNIVDEVFGGQCDE